VHPEFFIKVTCFIGENFRGTKIQKRKQSTPPPSIRFVQSTRPQDHKTPGHKTPGHQIADPPWRTQATRDLTNRAA
jgi:hypothetical protein